MDTPKVSLIKNIYLYLVSFVALMMVVFSVADLVNLALKTWVFTKVDNYSYMAKPFGCDPAFTNTDPNYKRPTTEECVKMDAEQKQQEAESRAADKQRSAVRDISFLAVGIPLFAFHWWLVRKKEQA